MPHHSPGLASAWWPASWLKPTTRQDPARRGDERCPDGSSGHLLDRGATGSWSLLSSLWHAENRAGPQSRYASTTSRCVARAPYVEQGDLSFIANTDFGWFSHFLHRAEPPDEVDFWQPSPHGFKAIPPSAPFFFRLGAPDKAIAGFGFFARYERVPVWLAWESFGDLNGADTFAEMTARIEAIRRRTGSALLARPQDHEVGCIMISQPVFFPRDDWVAEHADWHPRIQGGKTIDVSGGDGRRVFAECLGRAAVLRPGAEPLADELRRYGAPRTVQPHLGQGTFRIAVTSAYGACAVSGEHSLPALEADRLPGAVRGRPEARVR